MNEASGIESRQCEEGSSATHHPLGLGLEKCGPWRAGPWFLFLQNLISIDSWTHKGSHTCPSPTTSQAACCKVIFLYLLKLLFKEEFLIITQLQRADTVWLCLFSFS